MSPPTATRCAPESARSWLKEWKTHDRTGGNGGGSREEHEPQKDVWDELAEVDRIHRKKNADEVISYLESHLSQLTTVDSKEEVTTTTQHDIFSQHHREVIEKGAKKNE